MRLYALFVAAGFVGLVGSRASAKEPSAKELQPITALFQSHCLECHGMNAQEGGLRLDTLSTDFEAASVFATWVKIHDRLQAGEMPPKDAIQPPTSQRKQVVEWLRSELTEADLARRRAEGRSAVRRLNRSEYENTLRDLF